MQKSIQFTVASIDCVVIITMKKITIAENKGIICPKLKCHPFARHCYVDGGSDDMVINPHGPKD